MPSISVPAALIGGAAISGGASLLGSKQQADAASQAAAVQKYMFDTTQKNLQPFIGAGGTGLNQLMALLGLGPGGPAASFGALESTPGYQFQVGQGENALLAGTSATGGTRGGNTLRNLISFGQGMGQTDFQTAVSNAGGVASLGENAAANLGNTSAAVGQNIGNSIISAGNAASAGTIGVGNAVNGLVSNFLLQNLINGGGGANFDV